MRTSIFAALMTAAALVPGAAMAQRGGDDRGFNRNPRGATIESRLSVEQDRPDRGPRPDRPRPEQRGDDGPRGDRAQPAAAPAPVVQSDRGLRGVFRGDDGRGRGEVRGDDGARRGDGQWRGDNRGGNNQWRGNDNRGGNNQWRGNDRRPDWRNDRGGWNRGWRQDNRYDWNHRRQYDRNAFHLPRYYAPSGWGYGYRRFNIGITLNSGLFNRNYWIDDADYYGLPEAYGPYRWVRYYNDALLVDVYSGQVVDTVYDIFW